MFKNLAIFDFESICVKEANSYKQTETTTWIGKHVPIPVSISSNLIPEPIFVCNTNLQHLILSFITDLEGLATQSEAQMKLNVFEVETAIKMKLCAIPEQLNQRHNRAERVSSFPDDCIVEEEERFIYTIPANARESITWLTGNVLSATVTLYQSLDSTGKTRYYSDYVLFVTISCKRAWY